MAGRGHIKSPYRIALLLRPKISNSPSPPRSSPLAAEISKSPSPWPPLPTAASAMSSRQDKEKAVNVQVLLRCRPFSDDELRSNAPQVVTCNDYQREVAVTQTIAGKQFDRVFTFDKVFGPTAKQKDLYDQAIIPIVNEVLEGFNCTIFAYGQTGTGKTYTMEGECRRAKSGPKGQLPADAGVIPRTVKQIFDTLERQNTEYSVKVTFLELYNEEITDLLAPEEISKVALEDRQKKALPLMEDGKGGVLVRGLEEEIVTNADEIFSLLERGSAKRRTAETLLNKQSSRSHSLFSITIHIKEATPEGEELIKCGKLNLVDLAGSENISRSGAREGRAREAGEINKSLLTLGRVITALVEHLGHVPYRDSKLTRLLRDSLGGRTKTCIIATVSPSVHCLEETLSTLDYAHRAKSIKNRPEVNQKMMKSTLIKDLYGEIDRLKAEVYAAREKVGVYIPKDRYQQEENERKAMADQIEQMTASLETSQKLISDLQQKYNSELQRSADLSKKLEVTEKCLDHTSNLLSTTKEDLKQAHYNLKEKDFIISEQKKAENALAHQACVLTSDLEKFNRDNASLYSKIARGEKLSATNRSVVNTFQTDLALKLDILSNTLNASIDQQNKHLKSVEDLCQSCVDSHDKATSELKKKILASKSLYMSHVEAFQNVVLLHKTNTNGTLEDISSLSAASCCSLDQLLACVEGEAQNIFSDIHNLLTTHRSEMTHFTQELRESFQISLDRAKEMSTFIIGLFDKYVEETSKLQSHSNSTHEAQMKSLEDFQNAYEKQSKLEEQKLLADISSLVSKHVTRQRDLVGVRLNSLGDAARGNKVFLDEHTSAIDVVTKDAKRKWEIFAEHAENDCKIGSSFSAAKHCRMETMLQECACTVDSAVQQWKKSHAAVNDLSRKQLAEVEALVRIAIENNEQHEKEIASSRAVAEEHASSSSKGITQDIDNLLDEVRDSSSRVVSTVEAHFAELQQLQENHSSQAAGINTHADKAFQSSYRDYEPTGGTPVRSEPEVPSKGAIESLRAMPMETLMNEFRENHPYESSKEPKPSLIPRSPLATLN
ncbi:kinesin-like protein KIN-5C [Phragmites australis]|uniref:kinesin-like protein KIN-5C n=1 Tax=Phragmites australis TaxID=29695 RepID=UPI002D77C667|nr:kinesin-like protein KIN-5C [Phragmites australis]